MAALLQTVSTPVVASSIWDQYCLRHNLLDDTKRVYSSSLLLSKITALIDKLSGETALVTNNCPW